MATITIDERVTRLERRMDGTFSQIKDELDVIHGKLDVLSEDVTSLRTDVNRILRKSEGLERKFDKLEAHISSGVPSIDATLEVTPTEEV